MRNIIDIVGEIEKKNYDYSFIDHTGFCALWFDALKWCDKHDPALRSFIERESRNENIIKSLRESRQPASHYMGTVIDVRLVCLRKAADHLNKGALLGLTEIEQVVVDSLWGVGFHDYNCSYLRCAKDIAADITLILDSYDEFTKENLPNALLPLHNVIAEHIKEHKLEYDPISSFQIWEYLSQWFYHKYHL